MPLDGFHVIHWASSQFGSLLPMHLGGAALMMLALAITLLVYGAKMVPTSWMLVAAGFAAAVLAYFIVGTAINGSGGIQDNPNVQTAAWRYGPACVAIVVFGISGFLFRLSLRAWASDENSGKAFGLALFLMFAAGTFVSVQVVRGSLNPSLIPHRTAARDDGTRMIDVNSPDGPVRRSVSAPRRH
ncbi:MAG: hypothetical protein Q8Q09_12890 [Deltaproteobacteria bacterium]|nr:hypothetical protein [Deltaproteobacteria bacterium]